MNQHTHKARYLKLLALPVLLLLFQACAAFSLVQYSFSPDYPRDLTGTQTLPGLQKKVEATRRDDGLWRIEANNEHDLFMMTGYLQARDRFFQLDLFRRLAEGRLSELTGNIPFGNKSSLDIDIFNRFMGFAKTAQGLWQHTEADEKENIKAFADGVNSWLDQAVLPLEYRLLGVTELTSWRVEDSLSIYAFFMFGLSSNYNREVRRLAIACRVGLDRLNQVWPPDFSFDFAALPSDAWKKPSHGLYPAIVSEMTKVLPGLCPTGEVSGLVKNLAAAFWPDSWEASNNWAVAGKYTASGSPILANDPHLPHINPPVVWGMEQIWPGHHLAGFTLPGLHRVVFGHNGKVAWGATTNHVDKQDLAVLRPVQQAKEYDVRSGYEFEGRFRPYILRSETFRIRNAPATTVTVRFTNEGPVLNDLDPEVRGWIPLVALRTTGYGAGTDLNAAKGMNDAENAEAFAKAVSLMNIGCANWVYADNKSIGYRSPCLIPKRKGWKGTFPVPGWIAKYEWGSLYAKDKLPAVDNPRQGWLATSNSRNIPPGSLPSAYNNDASPPGRARRSAQLIKQILAKPGGYRQSDAEQGQLDIVDKTFIQVRMDPKLTFCHKRQGFRTILCRWNGKMASNSIAATLFAFTTNKLLDFALADAFPLREKDPVWLYAQHLFQFEANVRWLWQQPVTAPVWDDYSTGVSETKNDILALAFAAAITELASRYGSNPQNWQWGTIRPFVLRHPFAGTSALLGRLLNSKPVPGAGGVATLFKSHYLRSDRENMRDAVGPVVRYTIDMARPWDARFTLAGGESGWPKSPYYANLVPEWMFGRYRPLTPPPSDSDRTLIFQPDSTGD